MKFLPFLTMLCSVLVSADKQSNASAHSPFTALDLVTTRKISEVEANPSGTKLIYRKRSYNTGTNSTSMTMMMLDIASGQSKDLTRLDLNNSRLKYQWVDDQRVGFTTYNQGKLAFWVMDIYKWKPVKHFERKTIQPKDSRFSLSYGEFTFVSDMPTREKDPKSFDNALFYDETPINDYKATKVRAYHNTIDSLKTTKGAARYERKNNTRKEYADTSMGAIIDDLGIYGSTKNKEANSGKKLPQAPPNIPQLSYLDPDSPISCISPDRKKYVVVKRAEFENILTKQLIILTGIETKKETILNDNWDVSVLVASFAKDGTGLLVTAQEKGQRGIYLLDLKTLVPHKITGKGGFNLVGSFKDGRIFVSKSSVTLPIDFLELTPKKGSKEWTERKISDFNKDLRNFNFQPHEPFYFKGANQDMVQGFMVKPPDFNPNKKYPLLVFIHGGPNQASDDNWEEYINHQVIAQAGFIIAEINFHGSVGFGDNFMQSIVKHWGDLSHKDIILGTKYLIKQHKFIDGEKVAAWGHSFGGYQINYLNGHNQDKLFKVFMVYAGIFDIRSSYYTSDLPNYFSHEFGSLPSDSINTTGDLSKSLYYKFSPSTYVANWNTPTIVVHGKNDLRIKDSEGISAFIALKTRNISSKFLYFQDEEHTITKPANLIRFFNAGLNFTATYLNHTLPYTTPPFYVNQKN